MFRGFIYKPEINYKTQEDVQEYDKEHSPIDLVNRYIIKNKNGQKVFDADRLQESTFPPSDCDVFISYSHNDVALVKTIANKIEKSTGLKCFVDDLYWNSADKLSKALLDGTGLPPNVIRKPSNINYTNSTVYMLLCNSILQMIDRCEMFLFIDTPNSLERDAGTFYGQSNVSRRTLTDSPWIFMELEYSRYIKRGIPDRYNFVIEERRAKYVNFSESREDVLPFKALYTLKTAHLTEIFDVYDWLSSCSVTDGKENFDLLYDMYPAKDCKLTTLCDGREFHKNISKDSIVYVNDNVSLNINL